MKFHNQETIISCHVLYKNCLFRIIRYGASFLILTKRKAEAGNSFDQFLQTSI